MARKKPNGYFVNGEFVARGSARDAELQAESQGPVPSKTQLKADSTELQKLGLALAALEPAQREPIALPDRVETALQQLVQIHAFEGQRRQRQYVGKLMRGLDADTLAAARLALDRAQAGSKEDTRLLHVAEDWRDRLLASDAAATAWAQEFPTGDLQRLRTLVRQARKETVAAAAQAGPGEQTQRHTRAYRELFQLVRAALTQAAPDGPGTI